LRRGASLATALAPVLASGGTAPTHLTVEVGQIAKVHARVPMRRDPFADLARDPRYVEWKQDHCDSGSEARGIVAPIARCATSGIPAVPTIAPR